MINPFGFAIKSKNKIFITNMISHKTFQCIIEWKAALIGWLLFHICSNFGKPKEWNTDSLTVDICYIIICVGVFLPVEILSGLAIFWSNTAHFAIHDKKYTSIVIYNRLEHLHS